MTVLNRSFTVALGSLALLASAAQAATPPAPAPTGSSTVPVIFDCDIGGDIDDTWALIMLLKSPGLDVRLITTDYGDTVYRAKIAAKLLEIAGRTDIPIGVGIREAENGGAQAEWVRDYSLEDFPGTVHEDGVQALIDTVMASEKTLTLIAVGPAPNLAAALEREPRIAGRLRFSGMYGSLRRGYGGGAPPHAEWNVRANVPAARRLLGASWADAISTPLDTCGIVELKGERYARVRDSKDPLLQALMENYRLWCERVPWCGHESGQVEEKSSTLFDTVAVYLAEARGLVKTETLGVRVSDEGMTVLDETAPSMAWATEWKNLEGFEELLVERLTGATVSR